ncbi:GEVED domain-containing protein, partial [Flavobacterium sp. UBA2787]|uniref:GEVED domain-containing protein n=1 Tax=Flavobacterium sp. UBA2787 TaxID=1946543 RepID=UPI0025BB2D28
MIKYYNSLSWRLGTQLKTREPDGVGQLPKLTSEGAQWWSKTAFLCTILLLFSFVSFGFNDPSFEVNKNSDKKSTAYASAAVTTCAGATVLSPASLPIASQALVCGGTNDINSGNATACGSGLYMGGQEALYTLTPTTTGNYNIAIAGQTWTGIFVFQGCPTAGGTCVGNITSSSSSKNLNVSLTAGLQYYIMFDTYPSPNSPCPGTFSITPPPPPCVAPPAPGNTLASASLVCAGTAVTLSLQNATAGSGVTYQWQSSTDNVLWSDIVGATSSTRVVNPAANTFYRCNVTCSAQTVPSNSVEITLDPNFLACYNTNAATSAADEEISNVTLGTLNNSSTCATVAPGSGSILNRYSNYRGSVTAPDLTRGENVSFSLTQTSCGGAYGNGFQVYIDFNQNGLFEDSERVYNQPEPATGNHTKSGSFNIPVGALLGNTGMRVVVVETTFPTSTNYANTSYSWGETEDYVVNIIEAALCEGQPNAGIVTANVSEGCAGQTVVLSSSGLSFGAGITYQWQSSSSESGPWTDIVGETTGSLSATVATTTFYRLRTFCSASNQENFSNIVSYAVTLSGPAFCGTYCNPVYDFGKTDGDLISNISILGTTLSNNTGAAPVNPAYTFFFGAPNLTAELQAGSTYTVSVTVGTFGSQNLAAWIDYNDNGVFETTERIGFTTASIGANGTATFQISLACNPPLGEHRLRVRDVWNTAGNLINPCATYGFGETEDYVVTISAADPCPVPKNLTATNGTPTSGDLSWEIGCAEEAWEVVVQLQGLGTPAGSGTPVTETTFSVSDLAPGVYEYYVRANCEVNGFSSWAGPFVFTPPGCTTNVFPADAAEDVIIGSGEILFSWNATPGATGYEFWLGTSLANLTNLGTAPTSSITVTGIQKQTNYFWYVVPVNAFGVAVGCDSTVTTFTTEDADPGDICALALSLDALDSPLVGDTTGFTNASSPTCGTNTAPDIYYTITVPADYTLVIGQTTNDYDSRNFAFYGTCELGTQIACFDDDDTTTITWLNNTGETQTVYWVQDGFGSGAGPFTLAWSVNPPPVVVSGFTPESICGQDGGAEVVITGSNFTGATSVEFNGIEATSFVVDSDTQITAILPAGNTSGIVTVYAAPSSNGFASSDDSLIVNPFPVVNPITGADTALCMPTTLVLSSTSPGGTWSSSDEAVATVVGGTVTGVTPGTVTISYTVTDNGCTTVVTYDVDVNAPVVISSFTASQTVVTGNDATFSVSATGTGLTYQWFAFDGIDTYELDDLLSLYGESYTGSTSSSLVVGSVPADLNGFEFYCEVSGLSPCTPETTTPNSILNVGDTGIGSDPSNVTLCDGGSTTFTVVRSGDDLEEDITYAWEYDADGTDNWQPVADGDLDGMTISDSDTSVLSVSTITLVHNDYRFRAVVTGPANAATSNPATLTVNQGVSFSSQPESALVCRTTTTANFSVTATGAVTGIQWQVSPNGLDTWTNVGTGTSLNVAITPATAVGVTYYRAVVSGNAPCLAVNSDVVTLTVQQPTISVTPSSAIYCLPGEAVSLTASGAATYTWSPATGLSATTGATVLASPLTTTTYTVTGTDANGCVNTTNVTVSVSSQITGDATANLTEVCAEDPVQLGIIPTQVLPSYAINSALYRFEATSGVFTPLVGGTATSLPVGADDTLSTSTPIGFTFNYGGTNYTNFRVNSNGLLTFNATGNSGAFNQLETTTATFRPGLAPLWDDLQCTTGVTYQVSGVSPNRVLTVEWLNMEWNWSSTVGISFQVKLYEGTNTIEYVYRPEAGGNPTGSGGASIGLMGTAATNFVSLSNSSATPTVSTTTATNTIGVKPANGQIYRFIPSAPVTYSYAWTSTPEGFTSTAQNPIVNPSETTTYNVVVTSSAGCTLTSDIEVNVVSGVTVETQPTSLSQCEGTDASFTVEATGPSLTYQWRKDGVDIDGATSATLTITNIESTDAASYDVVITPLCGSPVTSDEVNLTVNALPTAVASNEGPVCEGSNLGLTGISDIGTTFSWTGPNGFSSTDQNPTISGVTLASAGTYTFTAISAAGCETSGTTSVTIFENPQVSISPSSDPLNACVGEIKNLSAIVNPVNVVVLTEDFNGATDNWTKINNSTGGTVAAPAWTLRPSGFVPPGYPALVTNDASQFYLSNSDAQGSGSNTNVILQSPAFSSVGMTALSLNFNHFYRDFNAADFAYVEVSTNGSTWTTVQTYTTTQGTEVNFANATVSLNAYINQPTVYVRYRYVAVWGYFWAINNVTVSGQTSPALTWAPTNDLYTDEAATVPYTGAPTSSVYARVVGPASYTVTSTTNGGCSSEDSVEFNITTSGCPSTTVVQPSQCGQTLAAIDSYVFANIVSGAQGYRFRVTNMTTNEVQTIDRFLRQFRITQLSNYAFNTTYMVEVAVRRNNVWESFYGSSCTVTTPDTTTQIQASQCNTTVTNINNSVFADIVPFATGYRFRVTNTLNPIDVQTIDRPIRELRMTYLANVQYNTTYNVEVAVRNTDGTYLSYGPVCNITTPLFPTVGLEDAQCDEYQVSSNTEILYSESYPG